MPVEPTTKRQIKRPVLRRVAVAVVFLAACIGIVFNTGTGTVSSFGWELVASICPLGALEAMLAAKLLIPQSLVFILITAVAMAVFGKFFCAWVCPIPSVRGLIDAITRRAPKLQSTTVAQEDGTETVALRAARPPARRAHTCNSCSGCEHRPLFDSRHLVLGGSLLSAAIFGFPVFCLVCPIGLTFASIIAIVQLFANQTLSLSLLVLPLMLILEMTLLRKWCAKICPLGAMVSLLSLPNRLLRPKVNMEKCLQSKSVDCQICSDVCPEELDPHYKQGMHDCSKCRDCAVNCPTKAISFPLKQ